MRIDLNRRHALQADNNEQRVPEILGEALERALSENKKDVQEEYVPPAHKTIRPAPTESNNDIIRRRILDYGETVASKCEALGQEAQKDAEEFCDSIRELIDSRLMDATTFKKKCDEAASLARQHAADHAEQTAKGNDRLKRMFDAASE